VSVSTPSLAMFRLSLIKNKNKIGGGGIKCTNDFPPKQKKNSITFKSTESFKILSL
jgi:hypothetical protein